MRTKQLIKFDHEGADHGLKYVDIFTFLPELVAKKPFTMEVRERLYATS